MRTRLIATIALGTLTSASIATAHAAAGSAEEDKARADAAIAVFNERMIDAGFESAGPQELQDELDEDADADEMTACFEGFEAILASLAEPADGETARAYSDDFSVVTEPDAEGAGTSAPGTTDPFGDLDATESEEYAAAFVITFDEDHGDTAERFVTHFGSDETAECFRDQFEQSLAMDTEGGEGSEPEYESSVEVVNDPDLGVGEHGAHVAFAVETGFMGESFDYTIDFYTAQVDRSLAMVLHGTYGDVEPTEVDYESELAAIVDVLAG